MRGFFGFLAIVVVFLCSAETCPAFGGRAGFSASSSWNGHVGRDDPNQQVVDLARAVAQKTAQQGGFGSAVQNHFGEVNNNNIKVENTNSLTAGSVFNATVDGTGNSINAGQTNGGTQETTTRQGGAN